MAEERKTSLTKRDINRVIARWYITTEMSLNYERMQSIAYTYALIPALKKLYPNKEDMIPALQRHLEGERMIKQNIISSASTPWSFIFYTLYIKL